MAQVYNNKIMEKILVTGGAGFIGSNFVHYILDKHPDVSIVNLDKLTYAGNPANISDLKDNPKHKFVHGDICDRACVEGCMSGVDAVVNFAAETHVDRSIMYAGDFIRTDVEGAFILLEASRRYKIKRFVQISTDEVYGEAPLRPSVEPDPLMPKSPYAASKAGADRLVFSYFATYQLPVVISRCSNNFGPFQYPEKLIPLFVTQVLDNKPVPIYGSGKNTRDWVHVLDHCHAIEMLLFNSGDDGEVYNIGTGFEKSILDITDIIFKELKSPESLKNYVQDRAGHVGRHAVNSDKFRKKYGWKPQYEFDSAIKATIEWYKNNRDWWEPIKYKTGEFKEYFNKQYLEREKEGKK